MVRVTIQPEPLMRTAIDNEPSWKILHCPCGRDVKIFYKGKEVLADAWEAEAKYKGDKKIAMLRIKIYGGEIIKDDFYFAEYKEVPYMQGKKNE
jgi:hypothetical protein